MRSIVILAAVTAASAANIKVARADPTTVVSSVIAVTSSASASVITTRPLPITITSTLQSTAPLPITSPAPVPAAVRIHPAGVSNKCLDVAANNQANGTPVQMLAQDSFHCCYGRLCDSDD